MKSVHIWSFSGPYFPRIRTEYRPEKLRIRTLFTLWAVPKMAVFWINLEPVLDVLHLNYWLCSTVAMENPLTNFMEPRKFGTDYTFSMSTVRKGFLLANACWKPTMNTLKVRLWKLFWYLYCWFVQAFTLSREIFRCQLFLQKNSIIDFV